jgi:hypothetical protein
LSSTIVTPVVGPSCAVEVVRLATDPRLKFEMSVIAAVPE